MLLSHETEQQRLAELNSFQILDTPPDTNFDRLTKLAALICQTPIALVSLIDEKRQWFKSSVGVDIKETPRCDAFCAHAIQGQDLFLVPDARLDPGFAGNPLVTSNFGLRFYAGIPLITTAGYALGTLCVLDKKPRVLNEMQIDSLQTLAEEVMLHLELHRQRLITEAAEKCILEQASLLDKARDAIIVMDMSNKIVYWNEGARKLYGWTREEMLGKTPSCLMPEHSSAYEPGSEALFAQGEWMGERLMVNKAGHVFPVEMHRTLVRNEAGEPNSIFSIEMDITERKSNEDKIHRLAFYDSLTNLPNRQLLLDRLQCILANAHRHNCHGALMFIDLDNFKTLNDTLGHDMGDLLLQKVALRLSNCIREVDTVGRLGGDEFIVILENLSAEIHEAIIQVELVGNKILQSLNVPYELSGAEHHSSPSIGVTVFNEKVTVEDLFKQADLAMYEAKARGRNLLCFYDPEMQKIVSENARIESDIRTGLRTNQFLFHYQPQRGIHGSIVGAEALARWQHPQQGLIYPAAFIPLAEATGLILILGQALLEIACRQLAVWGKNTSTRNITLAVNISTKQIRQADFVEQVIETLSRNKADPHKLKFELTESMLVENLEDTIAKMRALKTLGVSLALDDFGTGYSSLAYLKLLPLDQLKIDQSFIREVAFNHSDAAIARTIVALGEYLNLKVMAEGVETKDQEAFLEGNHCYEYQGSLFSEPLPIGQFEDFLIRLHYKTDRQAAIVFDQIRSPD